MKKISVITTDNSFIEELRAHLPEGTAAEEQISGNKALAVFFDLDSVRQGALREISENNHVIAATSRKLTEPVIEAATSGAYEVIQRPFDRKIISGLLSELSGFSREIKDIIDIEHLPPTPTCAIVGSSHIIMDVCKKLARLSQVDAPVLITGETGTGKELIAESIAQLSSRFGRPFVVVNCAAVPENLLESELFGFEKGSFTGAVASKEGMLRIADGGSVFFDEIGELPLPLQAKLLRFLQTQSFYPLGSTKEVHVDVRVLSATNRDLRKMVRQGTFREDLYHRLSVTAINIPPLRERKTDIRPLVQFFLNRYRHTAPKPLKGFTGRFLERLMSYEWPGNIRELENTVRSAIALARTAFLTTHELKELGTNTYYPEPRESRDALSSAVLSFMKDAAGKGEKNIYEKLHQEVDNTLLPHILTMTDENQSEAARILGISRLTLRKKLLR